MIKLKNKLQLLLMSLTILVMTSATKTRPTIFVIGDSTAAEKTKPLESPERGWAMVLAGCFSNDVIVDNHAVNGRSSKSFIDEGRWQNVLNKIKPGDYVIIQWGHNDEKANPMRHTDPGTTFDANLERYVRETRAKGATPILMSPVARRLFYNVVDHVTEDEALRKLTWGEEHVNSDTLVDTHGAYRYCAAHVAKKLGVYYVDANAISTRIEQKYGIEGSKKLHMWIRPGIWPAIAKGRMDNTHYTIYGARIMANALADDIGKEVPALRPYVRHYDYVVSKEGRGDYFSLQMAVDAVKSGQSASILVLDGKYPSPDIPHDKDIKIIYY